MFYWNAPITFRETDSSHLLQIIDTQHTQIALSHVLVDIIHLKGLKLVKERMRQKCLNFRELVFGDSGALKSAPLLSKLEVWISFSALPS